MWCKTRTGSCTAPCRRGKASFVALPLRCAWARLFLAAIAVLFAQAAHAAAQTPAGRPKNRADAVAKLAARLGIGEGSVVADVGAGNGVDTWVFAGIVGQPGAVYAEEVSEKLVAGLEAEARKRDLSQIRAVLGREDGPGLPPGSVDLAYMRYVYHHLSKPREMLRGIWKALKPGGYFVVVDRYPGTLRDWVPRAERKNKHFWLAETTVVREAREEGFLFSACAEDCCESPEPFVVVFQRPRDLGEPGRDPDPFLPLAIDKISPWFLPLGGPYRRPVFIALGEARGLMRPILERSDGHGLDVVLEEWATQKDERPPVPPGLSLPSTLTENGDPRLGDEPTDAVFFLDTYHLLFHGTTLLARLHDALRPTGCVYILDRQAAQPVSRREASHRRQIAPETVKEEMAAAGFSLWFEGPRPAADRFLLVFGKSKPEDIRPEDDPCFGGPGVDRDPGDWLRDNLWRLRGLKTADGRLTALPRPEGSSRVEKAPAAPPGTEVWNLPAAKLVLTFTKSEEGYSLTDCQPAKTQD